MAQWVLTEKPREVRWPQGWSRLPDLVRKDQEAGEDAVGALGAHHAIVVIDRQPHLLSHPQPQQHTARADLLAVGQVVTEGGHLDVPVVQLHAQVGRLRGVVHKVVEARDSTGELAGARVVISLWVGDDRVELDQAVGCRELERLPCDCEH